MKRNLSALALLASLAGTAFAQSNVTIYGIVDNGFIKETGSDITMGQNVLNRIGFKGSEDLSLPRIQGHFPAGKAIYLK